VERGDFEGLIEMDLRDALAEVDRAEERSGFTADEIDLVLLIGGTSRIPSVRQRLEDRFGARVHVLDNADSVIAEGAAVVHALGMQPVLAQDVGVRLSDGAVFEVFPVGTIAHCSSCDRTVDFFCTDNRSGEALLAITEKRGGDADYITKALMKIPVARALPKPYNHERVSVRFWLDQDLILNVAGKGATAKENIRTEIFDLAFGLSGEVASA
jgi:molecular chaperone DnaK